MEQRGKYQFCRERRPLFATLLTYNSVMPHCRERKPMRLHGFDYSVPGAYFITACTKNREFLFETNDAQRVVESAWYSLTDIFANIELGEFVVMPNHIHGILWIVGAGAYRLHPGTWKNDDIRRDGRLPVPPGEDLKFEMLSNIIGAFKTTAATGVNKLRGMVGVPVWQRSFYDHIIRDHRELERIQKYIKHNPIHWAEDRNNPDNLRFGLQTAPMDEYSNEVFDIYS
jgi:putative transposase